MSQPEITLTLSGDAALVLDAALADPDDVAARLNDPAGQAALWELEGALETQLVATFDPNYAEILHSARQRLMERAGVVPVDGGAPPTAADSWMCCFCGHAQSEGEASSVRLQVFGGDGESQGLRAHARCLRRHLHRTVPILDP